MTKTKIVKCLIDAFKRGNFVYICGNGGSASMAQHFAAEFMCKFEKERRPLPAIALTTDTSFLTAFPNDFPDGFERIFARQIEALGKKGDVLIALSSSGKSKNVLLAIKEAKKKEMVIIDFPRVGNSTPRVQENQLRLMHAICSDVENAFI